MKTKTYKIFSYCEDFAEYPKVQTKLSQGRGYDCFILYTAYTLQSLKTKEHENDPISNLLVKLGADDGEEVLIHLDW